MRHLKHLVFCLTDPLPELCARSMKENSKSQLCNISLFLTRNCQTLSYLLPQQVQTNNLSWKLFLETNLMAGHVVGWFNLVSQYAKQGKIS